MAYQYKLTPLAVSDINDTLDYIANKLMNPSAAEHLFHELRQEIIRISENPYSFPDCSYYLIDDDTIRHSVVGHYVLIFAVSEADQTIHILRFLYGAMDIPNIDLE